MGPTQGDPPLRGREGCPWKKKLFLFDMQPFFASPLWGPCQRGIGVQAQACSMLVAQRMCPDRKTTPLSPPLGQLLFLRGSWGGGGRDALEGAGPQRRPQKWLDGRLEEVAKAVGGGYCRLRMPLRLAFAVRGTVAGHRLGALERGGGPLLRWCTAVLVVPWVLLPAALHFSAAF